MYWVLFFLYFSFLGQISDFWCCIKKCQMRRPYFSCPIFQRCIPQGRTSSHVLIRSTLLRYSHLTLRKIVIWLKKLPKTWHFFKKIAKIFLFFFQKNLQFFFFQKNCQKFSFFFKENNDKFWQFCWKKCQVFGNFLTFKWQFSGGSDEDHKAYELIICAMICFQ